MAYKKKTKGSVEALFSSEEYKNKLSDMLNSIIKYTRSAPNEASLASIFENKLYYFIRNFFSVEILFKKEVGEGVVRHRFVGRMDALSNDLVIEYKHPSKMKNESDKNKATEQVISYLKQLQSAKNGKQYSAILTDGNNVKYFYFRNNILETTPFSNIGIDDLDNIVRSLLIVNYKKFVPENITKDFSLASNNGYTKDLALCLFQFLDDENITEKTSMLYNEWEELFHLSESDQGKNADIDKRRRALSNIFETEIDNNDLEYKSLFALQTTYAIIVKLIACKTISKLAFNNEIVYFSDLTKTKSEELQQFFEKLENGHVFSDRGIINLLEGDFFSWYCSEDQWSLDEANIIKNIIKTLEGYTNISFSHKYETVDIFKDLYMEIIPNEVRHSFGEYFTPAWLADYVVENSIPMVKKNDWRAIDPCCGSGIFIVSLIKKIVGDDTDISKLTPSEKESLLYDILNRVIGIDLNPLSVLTARVSYFLAISMLIGNNKIEIPVYLGDSANVPKIINLEGVDCYRYDVSTKKGVIPVTLPCSFVKSKKFVKTMNFIQSIIKTEDADIVYNELIDNIQESEKNDAVLGTLKTLSKKLIDLHVNKWDGVWIRIATNFMLVAKIQDVDIIVGNPPWVKWEFLPQKYAEKIKSICIARHLFSGQTYMGAISLNICALISNVTASEWLNPGGVLAFLMPKTLMTQDSYAGFRNFYIDYKNNKRLFLQRIDDWSESGNPFIYTKEKFLTYYYKTDKVDYSSGIPITNFIKKKNVSINEVNRCRRYRDAIPFFDIKNGMAYQLDKNRTGFTLLRYIDPLKVSKFRDIIGKCEYKARSGVEFTPAEIYFIQPVRPTNNSETYMFKNSKFRFSTYKSVNDDEFELEVKYIRPVIKSPCIERFKIKNDNNYCIFPYDNGVLSSVPIKDLSKNCKHLTRYLLSYKSIIEKQSLRSKAISKGDDFYALSKIGAYTFAENIVTFRDNTRFVSAVVEPVLTPWGKISTPVCAKHAPYISMDKNNRYITKDEAYYICGILNTTLVQEYFKFTYSGRSYSINFNIKLPLYDESNFNHKRICELSKKAHKETDNKKIEDISSEIEELYLNICKNL